MLQNECRSTYVAGEALDPEAAFRPLMPHLLCTDATWVKSSADARGHRQWFRMSEFTDTTN